jgi:voltage-gated sodium channel
VGHRDPDNALWQLVESPLFATAIMAAIVGNAVVLGLQTYDVIVAEHGALLEFLNDAFLAVFVVELTLRITAYGRRPQDFFRSGWNVFDFVVIAAAFVPGLRGLPTILRLLRLLRVLRLVRVLPELQILVTAIVRSLRPATGLLVLLTMLFFIFGMGGWLFFGEELPNDWGTLGRALLSLFLVLTLAEISDLLREAMTVHPMAWLFFVSFVASSVYVVLNVFIGIVLHSMQEAREIERRQRLRIGAVSVMERIQILRAALDELEQELAVNPETTAERTR